MTFPEEQTRANREYFVKKLSAEKARTDVLKAVQSGSYDFTLLDTRGSEPFAQGRIPGALCAPMEELAQLAAFLPRDRKIVTYCWGHD